MTGLPITEAELQQTIVDALRLCGYLVFHARPAQTTRGWRTALQGDVGFPDLVCARAGRVLALELKGDGGKLRPGQQEWLDVLDGAVVDARVVRPAGLDELLALVSDHDRKGRR